MWVFTGKDNRDERCYSEFSSDEGVLGEPGKTYVQVIQMTFQDSERDGPVPRRTPASDEHSSLFGPETMEGAALRESSCESLVPHPPAALGLTAHRGAARPRRARLERLVVRRGRGCAQLRERMTRHWCHVSPELRRVGYPGRERSRARVIRNVPWREQRPTLRRPRVMLVRSAGVLQRVER